MQVERFTIVGGASAYTPGLVAALLHHADRLSLQEIRLFDIQHENLATVEQLLQKMIAAAGVPWKLTAHTDLEQAVEGVDAVLNSSRPGGLECRHIDETLPLECAIPGQETVGPGGFFFALRSVPEAHRLADAVAKKAPNAIILNYTNPSNIVTQALCDRGDVQVVGLCDQSDEDLEALAEACGFAGAEVSFSCIGLNHATWYSDIYFDSTAFASLALPEQLPMPKQVNEEHRMRFRCSEARAHQYPGLWPNSYLAYYDHPELFVQHTKTSGPRSDAIMAKMPSYYQHFREQATQETPVLQHHRGSAGFGDLAVHILQAFDAKEPSPIVLNVSNQGISSHFLADTVIEARLHVSREGITRTPAPRYPEAELTLVQQLQHYQRLTAKAATTAIRNDALEALAANPLVPSEAVAQTLLTRAEALYPRSSFQLR